MISYKQPLKRIFVSLLTNGLKISPKISFSNEGSLINHYVLGPTAMNEINKEKWMPLSSL